jgi:hypothetical protein
MSKALAFAKLDAWIAERGEIAFFELASRVGSGELPSRIAQSIGVPWFALKAWIEDDPERMALVELAVRAGADQLEAEALQEVRKADSDTVSLAKLRYESYVRSAGFRDRKKYGNKVDVEVGMTVSIVDALREARGRVVEGSSERVEDAAHARQTTYLPATLPVTHTEI